MRQIIILLTIFIASCNHEKALNHEKSQKNGITCKLTSEQKVYKLGEVPKLNVKIVNYTDSSIVLVYSIDGSSHMGRFPYAYFIIDKLNDVTYKMNEGGYCGNNNQIRTSDFMEVKRGETFYPYFSKMAKDHKIQDKRNFVKPGKYNITFYYSTNEPNLKKWLGCCYGYISDKGIELPVTETKEYKDAQPLFLKVPKILLVSNTITIEIK